MAQDIGWGNRADALISGALAVWRIDGRVIRDDDKPCAITVFAKGIKVTVERITDDGDDPYWEVASHEPGASTPPLPYAGIQGMLRAVRGFLDPDQPAARLVIGSGEA